jgi:hypothetical protein
MEEPSPLFRDASERWESDEAVDDVWIDEDCEMYDFESSDLDDDYNYSTDAASSTSHISEDTILVEALAQYIVDTYGDWKDDKETQIPLSTSATGEDEVVDNVLPESLPKPSYIMPLSRCVTWVDRKTFPDQMYKKCFTTGSRTALVGLGGVG